MPTEVKLTLEQSKAKIEEFQRRTEAVAKRKAVLEGQKQVKLEELESLIKEIEAAGYSPKSLVAERDKAQQELADMAVDYEKRLSEVEKALAVYDKK